MGDVKKAVKKVGSGFSNLISNPGDWLQNIGKDVGKGLGAAAPFLPPGLSQAAGFGGSVLQGNNMQEHLMNTMMASLPGLGGMIQKIPGVGGALGGLQSQLSGLFNGAGLGNLMNLPGGQGGGLSLPGFGGGNMGNINPMAYFGQGANNFGPAAQGLPGGQGQGGIFGGLLDGIFGGSDGRVTGGSLGKLLGGGYGGGQQQGGAAQGGQGSNGGFNIGGLNIGTGGLLGGLGIAGLLTGAFDKLIDPKLITTPRDQAGNAFAGMAQQGLSGQNVGQKLAQGFQLPGFGGQLAAGMTPDQQAAIQGGADFFRQNMANGFGQNALDPLRQFAQGGQDQTARLQQFMQGNPQLAQIANGQGPEFQQIMAQLAGGSPGLNDIRQQMGQTNPYGGQLAQSGGNVNGVLERLMGMGGQQAPGIGDLRQFAQGFNIPAAGQLAGRANFAPDALQRLAGFQGGTDTSGLQRIAQAFGGASAGEQGLLNANTGIAERDMLRQFQAATPERQMLLQAAGGNPIAPGQQGLAEQQNLLRGLMGNPAAQQVLGGGQTNINQMFSALDAQRRQGLARDTRDLREQFSAGGLRRSSNLQDAVAQRQSESEAGLMAEMARVAPQIASQVQQGQLGALQTLGGLAGQLGGAGQAAGQLGLAQQQNVLGALGQAGQLGLGGSDLAQRALGQAGQLGLGSIQAQLEAMGQAGSLANQRGSAAANALGQAGQLNLQGQGMNLDALGQLLGGQLNSQQMGNQALQAAGGLQAQQGQIQGDLLSQLAGLGQSGQAQQLQALLGAGQLGLQQGAQQQQGLQAAGQLAGQDMGRNADLAGLLGQLGLQGQGQNLGALQGLLNTRTGAAEAAGAQNLQAGGLLSQMLQSQQGNQLQAMLGMPGAQAAMSQLPMQMAQQMFNLGEGGRGIQDLLVQRQIQDFQQQQSLIPQMLGYFGSTPQQMATPSILSQLGNLGVGYGAIKGSK